MDPAALVGWWAWRTLACRPWAWFAVPVASARASPRTKGTVSCKKEGIGKRDRTVVHLET